MTNPNDPPAVQRMDELLAPFVPDQTFGTPGGDLKSAIMEAICEADRRATQRHVRLIAAVLRGDLEMDVEGDLHWVTRMAPA